MNEYLIIYSTQEGNAQRIVIERSEAAARKIFKADHKDAEISDVELVRTDVNATKAQERETLEKIKAMVAELGPNSYLKTAFDGVFEDAEQNIEDDAAYSMKARLELQAQRAINLGYEVDRLKAEIKKLNGGIDELIQKDEERKVAIIRLEAERDEIKKHVLPALLYRDAWTLATDEAEVARARMEETAEIMAHFAETPQDIAFKSAVENYRKAKARRFFCTRIAERLDEIAPKE